MDDPETRDKIKKPRFAASQKCWGRKGHCFPCKLDCTFTKADPSKSLGKELVGKICLCSVNLCHSFPAITSFYISMPSSCTDFTKHIINYFSYQNKLFCFVSQGTSLVVQWLTLPAPNASGPGSIPGQETRFHMPQLRVHMLQPQIQCAKMKSKDSNQDPTPKPGKYINIKKKKVLKKGTERHAYDLRQQVKLLLFSF